MKRVIPFLPWLGALLLIAIALLCYESDLLWKIQQYNLFLDTSLFLKEQMLVPGGFLSYISCYFTQYFYHPWLGVTILCGWWLLLMWLTKQTFRIADNWVVLTLIPVALLLIANMDLGYWHYFMRLRGYFYVATIGTTAAVAMLWAFRTLPKKLWLRIVFILVAAAVGYPLLGIYGLAVVLLMAVWTWRLNHNHTQNAILTVVALLCLIAVPLICYRYIYYQINYEDLWTAALPAFIVLESYPAYYIPYYLLGAFFLLMVTFSIPSSGKKAYLVQGVLAVALIAAIWHWWYKDDNFHHELVMQHCIEQADWEGVLNEGKKQGDEEPTRPIVLMHNLALQRTGRQLDEMYNFPNGKKTPNTILPYDMLYHVFSRMIYYQYGLFNDCHRRCMEDGVEYGWHVEIQQYMARCSMLMGEKQAAQKALNLLRHTTYYGEWADNMQQLMNDPKQMAENRETGPVTHMMHYHNALGSDGGRVEQYIMGQLSVQDSDDPYFQEQAILGALWTRNAKMFWPRFFQYARLRPRDPMPRIFQEGAYLFGNLEDRPDLERMPFDKGVKANYVAFLKEAKKYDGQGAEIGRAALSPTFGNTYYYFYYFLQDIK
jgi:hypothetical protein